MHIKLTLASNNHEIRLPCKLLQEDRLAHGGNGPHPHDPHDRIKVEVSGVVMWVQRDDLCEDDGAPFDWEFFYKPVCPVCKGKYLNKGCTGCDPYVFDLDTSVSE